MCVPSIFLLFKMKEYYEKEIRPTPRCWSKDCGEKLDEDLVFSELKIVYRTDGTPSANKRKLKMNTTKTERKILMNQKIQISKLKKNNQLKMLSN